MGEMHVPDATNIWEPKCGECLGQMKSKPGTQHVCGMPGAKCNRHLGTQHVWNAWVKWSQHREPEMCGMHLPNDVKIWEHNTRGMQQPNGAQTKEPKMRGIPDPNKTNTKEPEICGVPGPDGGKTWSIDKAESDVDL